MENELVDTRSWRHVQIAQVTTISAMSPLAHRVVCCVCTRAVVIGAKRTWQKFMRCALIRPAAEENNFFAVMHCPAFKRTVQFLEGPDREHRVAAEAQRGRVFDPNATLTSFLVTKVPAKARDRYGRGNSYGCCARPETIVELDL